LGNPLYVTSSPSPVPYLLRVQAREEAWNARGAGVAPGGDSIVGRVTFLYVN